MVFGGMFWGAAKGFALGTHKELFEKSSLTSKNFKIGGLKGFFILIGKRHSVSLAVRGERHFI